MSVQAMEKVEFLSAQWLELFRSYVREGLAGLDLSEIEFGLCEVYKNVPEHLRHKGAADIAFGFRIRRGKLEFPTEPFKGAEISIVADYAALAPWVTLPLKKSRAIGVSERLSKAGAVRIHSTVQGRPELMQRLNLHDRMAQVTKPYESACAWEP